MDQSDQASHYFFNIAGKNEILISLIRLQTDLRKKYVNLFQYLLL